MEIFAINLSFFNPFEKVCESQKEFLIQTITLLVLSLLSVACMMGVGALFIVNVSMAPAWTHLLITGVTAASSYGFAATISVLYCRHYYKLPNTKIEQRGPGPSLSLNQSSLLIDSFPVKSSSEDVTSDTSTEECGEEESSTSTVLTSWSHNLNRSSSGEFGPLAQSSPIERTLSASDEEIVPQSPPNDFNDSPRPFPTEFFEKFISAIFSPPSQFKIPSIESQLRPFYGKNVDLSPNSLALLDKLQTDYPVCYEREVFAWLKKVRLLQALPQETEEELTAEQNIVLINSLKEEILSVLELHWEECSQGYKEGELEESLNTLLRNAKEGIKFRKSSKMIEEHIALCTLIPFGLRFYLALGNSKAKVLSWLSDKKELFLDFFCQDKAPSFRHLLHFFFDLFTKVVTPFNGLISGEDFAGKDFLIHFMHHAVFHLLPITQQSSLEATKQAYDNAKENGLQTTSEEEKKNLEWWQTFKEEMKVFSEDFSEDSFNIYPLFTQALDDLIENIELTAQKKERYLTLIALQENLLFVVLPLYQDFFSQIVETGNFFFDSKSLCAYLANVRCLKGCEEASSSREYFVPYNLEKESLSLAPTIDAIFAQLLDVYHSCWNKELPLLFSNGDLAKQFASFHESVSAAGNAFSIFIPSIFDGSVSSAGEFFVKSFLISNQWIRIYGDQQSYGTLIKQLMEEFIIPLKNSGMDTKEIEAFAQTTLEEILSTLDKGSEGGITVEEGFSIIPFQDLLLAVFIGLFAVKHFHLLRPFLSDHSDLFVTFLLSTDLPAIKKHESVLRTGFTIMLKILMPMNGLAQGSYPGKSLLVKGGVEGMYLILKQFIKSQKSKALLKDNLPIPQNSDELLSKNEHLLFNLSKPFAKFLFLALFGGGWVGGAASQEEELKKFQEKLKNFYKDLYNFNHNFMAENPEDLKKHIQALMNNTFPVSP